MDDKEKHCPQCAGETGPGPAGRKIASSELFHGKTPREWRALYADAFDWGPDLGREAVEE